MSISLSEEMTAENLYDNGEQQEQVGHAMIQNEVVSWPDENELDQEQPFAKTDFEKALEKVARKVKK